MNSGSDVWAAVDSQPSYYAMPTDGWAEERNAGCVGLRSDGNRCTALAVNGFCKFHLRRLLDWMTDDLADEATERARRYSPSAFRWHTEAAALRDAHDVLNASSLEVYFTALDDIVKIGFSKNVLARFNQIRTGSASRTLMPDGYDLRDAVLLGSIPGGRNVERAIHLLLATYRVSGEWFRLSPTVIQAIDHYLYDAAPPKAIERGLRHGEALREAGWVEGARARKEFAA